MNKYLILFCFVLLLLNTKAQKQYVDAEIVTKSNEVLVGQIHYNFIQQNPKIISFRQGDVTRKMKPSELLQFSIKRPDGNTDIYFSRIISKEVSHKASSDWIVNIDYLDREKDLRMEEDTAFLLQLVDGDASLFFLQDNFGPHYFLEKNDKEIKELISKHYFDQSAMELIKTAHFKSTIKEFLNDCISDEEIESVEYDQESFMNLVIEYNRCKWNGRLKKDSYIYESKRSRARIGIMAGFLITNYNISKVVFDDPVAMVQYNTTFTPILGGSFNWLFANASDRISFYSNIYFYLIDIKAEVRNQDPKLINNYITDVEIESNGVEMAISLMVRYIVYDGKFKPYVQLGYQSGLVGSVSSSYYIRKDYFGTISEEEGKRLVSFGLGGITGGIGIQMNSWELEWIFLWGRNTSVNGSHLSYFSTGLSMKYMFDL